MIYSMTGYGKGTAAHNKISVEIEVRSVNSRYLDISLRLPSSLLNKEYELRELIKKSVKRGKISISIQLKRNGTEDEELTIDREKLKTYVSLLKGIKKAAKLTDKIKLDHLLQSKDIFAPIEQLYSEDEFELIKKALAAAIDELLVMKKNEGHELAADLANRIKIIEEKLDVIEKNAAVSVAEYFETLKERIKILIADLTPYNERLQAELALIADRADATEECVRLRSHLKFFLESLYNEDEPGRKLNFLCQEMNREANTISSKSVSTLITHNTVLIKEEIEKIREQIQNIE
jgi:uncharacterized protein (TIGR00255 family)